MPYHKRGASSAGSCSNVSMSSVPSMVHRSGDGLVVRSVVSGNTLYGEAAEEPPSPTTTTVITSTTTSTWNADDHFHLPECKVKRNYSCNSCDFYTQNPRLYLYHLREVHAEKVRIYECPNCLYASRHFQKLLRHTKMVHQGRNNNNNATIPNNNAVVVKAAKSSRKRRRSPPPQKVNGDAIDEPKDDDQDEEDGGGDSGGMLRCSVCAYVARNRAQLARHERQEHIKTRFFRCTKCNYVTHMKARFTKHVKYHSMPMIKCDLCDFRTPYKWNLDRHYKNHNGRGTFRCSACNFTADIKQSLTVHEMNHHVPPVGQAAGLGVGRRRNKVGASDATAVEDTIIQQMASASAAGTTVSSSSPVRSSNDENSNSSEGKLFKHSYTNNNISSNNNNNNNGKVLLDSGKKIKLNQTIGNNNNNNNNNSNCAVVNSSSINFGSDFIHPDDIVQHSNGNVYIKTKCKLCNYKTAWSSEMTKHERRVHNIYNTHNNNNNNSNSSVNSSDKNLTTTVPPHQQQHNNNNNNEEDPVKVQSGAKKTVRPVPNLIPLPSSPNGCTTTKSPPSSSPSPNKLHQATPTRLTMAMVPSSTAAEPVLSQQLMNDICAKSANSTLKDLASLFGSEDVFKGPTPTSMMMSDNNNIAHFKTRNQVSFFDRFKDKLMTGAEGNLICKYCGHESKCLTAQAKHQQICGNKNALLMQRYPHHTSGYGLLTSSSRCQYCRQRCKSSTDLHNHLLMCPDALKALNNNSGYEDHTNNDEKLMLTSSHPMENRVFVWNNILNPMEMLDVSMANSPDDNVSLDLSIRTQSPGGGSESSSYISPPVVQEVVRKSPHIGTTSTTTEKIPTHGTDISIAQHKRVFKCPHCSFWASTASRFHVHIVGHLNKKPFECSLCAYRSNWRWDITKHIKLKSVRDPAHESAKVLMTDETGRRNYTKYNKYLTEIHVSGEQSMETSGGSGTRPKNHDRNSSPIYHQQQHHLHHHHQHHHHHHHNSGKDVLPKLTKAPEFVSGVHGRTTALRPPPPLKAADGAFFTEKRKSTNDSKKTLFKCKKCNFRDASRDILLSHVKGHYPLADGDYVIASGGGGGGVGISVNNNANVQNMQNLLGTCDGIGYVPAATSSTYSDGDGCIDSLDGDGTTDGGDTNSLQDMEAGDGGGTLDHTDEASGTLLLLTAKGSQAPFRCGHCNQVSNWKHVIQRHCRLKHSGNIRVVSTKNGQERIEVEDQMDEPDHVDLPQLNTFKCNSCPFSTDNHTEFQDHLPGHFATINHNAALKCHFCTYHVKCHPDLMDHLRLHGVGDPEEFMKRVTELRVAASALSGDGDNGSKRFRCIICPYVTNSKSQYTYHKQFHKPRGGQYNCSHCSYNVSKRHLLHQHLKVHGINNSSTTIQHQKQNGDCTDEMSDDIIEELPSSNDATVSDQQQFIDIPLVWVSKAGKFSKMFKCRYCPHVNLRKVNIQEHEKMHSTRERPSLGSTTRLNDVEHRCTECNYVCNNAGVLSSHSKVHQGICGTVHCLVDPIKSDEEQIRELSKFVIDSPYTTTDLEPMIDTNDDDSPTVINFCQECPARFLKETEYTIHTKLHGLNFVYKCPYCSYSAKQQSHLVAHKNVHSTEYQERTRKLVTMYQMGNRQPQVHSISSTTVDSDTSDDHTDDVAWIVMEVPKPQLKIVSSSSYQNVPLSGTELFQQKSEAQLKHQQQQSQNRGTVVTTPHSSRQIDPQFGTLMRGNPDFIYPTYLKNGRMKEKRYKCHKCPSAFEKREQYKVHLSLHGSMQRYCCEHCDYSVKYYANYVQHLKKHKMCLEAQNLKDLTLLSTNVTTNNTGTNDAIHEVTTTDEDGKINQPDEDDDDDDVDVDEPKVLLSTSDRQALNILQQRLLVNNTSRTALRTHNTNENSTTPNNKTYYWCSNCPYVNSRKDSVDNHQKRHISVSGITNNYTCQHCDYSVPQAHFLREHTKLHFVPNTKQLNCIDGYMYCDNFKLTSADVSCVDNDDDEDADQSTTTTASPYHTINTIYQESTNSPVSHDLDGSNEERFNNNDGEKLLVNSQTGEVTNTKDIPLKSCSTIDTNNTSLTITTTSTNNSYLIPKEET